MVESSPADDTLPQDSRRQISYLRFSDPDVERAFRQFHIERCLPTYRVLFAFILVFQVVLVATGPVVDNLSYSDPRLWVRTGFGVTQAVVGFWAIRQPGFLRWGEVFMVSQVVIIGLMLATLFSTSPLGFTRMMTFLISTTILTRLRMRQAVVAITIELTAFGLLAWFRLPDADTLLPPRMGSLLIAGLLLVVGTYMLEQSERRDFLLARLLRSERAKSERLLLNVLPPAIVERLKNESGPIADVFAEVTVLFADIVAFTPSVARWGPGETLSVLNDAFSCFDDIVARHGVEKIQTVGDGYLLAGGIPEPRRDHALAVVAAGLDMLTAIGRFRWPDGQPLTARIGISSGSAVAGVIGTHKFSYDIFGDTVNTAARMQQHGVIGSIQLTEATYELVRHRYACTARQLTVKGKGRMRTWLLEPAPALSRV